MVEEKEVTVFYQVDYRVEIKEKRIIREEIIKQREQEKLDREKEE